MLTGTAEHLVLTGTAQHLVLTGTADDATLEALHAVFESPSPGV